MADRMCQRGFTAWGVLVPLLAVVILASLLFPIFAKARCRCRPSTCVSQIRQIATAVQMYAYDHDRFPGVHWVDDTVEYIGSKKIYHCPVDNKCVESLGSGDRTPITYAYSRLLLDADGQGVTEKAIITPEEVGAVCDATPSRHGIGGLIGGGTLHNPALASSPAFRHNGVMIGYCDGHAGCVPGNQVDERDTDNRFVRAFYLASALGFVQNYAGNVAPLAKLVTTPTPLVLGGEPCTQPLLHAVAKVWQKQGTASFTASFAGQYATNQQQNASVWGCADGEMPKGHAVPIARDAVVVIVSRQSKLLDLLEVKQHMSWQAPGRWAVDTAGIRHLFSAQAGQGKSAVVGYTYGPSSGTRRFFTRFFGASGKPMGIGQQARVVRDDWEMVKLVGADPYGIGYCSSAIVDPEKVLVLPLQMPDGQVHRFDPRHAATWPLARTLYAAFGGKAWDAQGGTAFGNQMLAPGSPGMRALEAGVLFKASYWTVR